MPESVIRIDPEFASLIPPLSADELAGLEASIAAEGCRDALVVWNGILLDGHNRKAICERLGVPYCTVDVGQAVADRLDARIWIRLNASSRRNLTDSQRAMHQALLAEDLSKQAKRDRAKKGRKAGGKATAEQKADRLGAAAAPKRKDRRNKSVVKAARAAKVSERQVRKAQEVRRKAPDLVDAVLAGDLSLQAAVKEARSREKAADRAAIPANLPAVTERYRVFQGDIREFRSAAGRVPAESLDWIITDPPYPAKYLPLYGTLREFAGFALKPGGGLIVMVGQSYLPEVLASMAADNGSGLRYHWTLAYLTPGGQSVQLWGRKVNTFWKPLLWYVKDRYEGDWVGDVCRSAVNDNDKRFHDWGQSESGMADIIERFTLPGQTICDPFCGAGTTGVVAVRMNRLFIGLDVEADAVKGTLHRLSKEAANA